MPRRAGRYEIDQLLGRGGMATVHLARQPTLDRDVALKELRSSQLEDPAAAHRFLRESRLAGSLNHPNVVTVYEYFEHDGVPYIAMEYLERGSLRPHVGRLGLPEVLVVLEGILAGLAAAAEQGVVHRDLKPENVLLTSDGHVKLADFGIAKALDELTRATFQTGTGLTVGTPAYIAPEQATGLGVTPQADLYATGIVAYELLAGRHPYHDTQAPMALLLRHVNDAPPPLAQARPELPPALCAWVHALLEKSPEARPPGAAAAREALEAIAVETLGPRWRRDASLALASACAPPTGAAAPSEPADPAPPSLATPGEPGDAAPASLAAAAPLGAAAPPPEPPDVALPELAPTLPPRSPVPPPAQPRPRRARRVPAVAVAVAAALVVVGGVAAAVAPPDTPRPSGTTVSAGAAAPALEPARKLARVLTPADRGAADRPKTLPIVNRPGPTPSATPAPTVAPGHTSQHDPESPLSDVVWEVAGPVAAVSVDGGPVDAGYEVLAHRDGQALSVACAPTVGTPLPVGTTTVRCQAGGDSHAFPVTVSGPEPTPTPTATATPSPSPTPTATPTATPTPEATPTTEPADVDQPQPTVTRRPRATISNDSRP